MQLALITLRLAGNRLAVKAGFLLSFLVLAFPVAVSAESVKVAFTGDQGVGDNARAVLSLIASEGTDLLMIQGDLGYDKNKADKWESNLNDALGRNFPVLALVGNHENFEWPLYQRLIERRINRVENLSCSGNVGVKSECRYKNIEVVQVSPGISEVDGVDPDDDYAGFIRSSFEGSSSRWRICTWHKNQSKLQTGQKGSSTGWGVYDACLDAGAMVVVAHEHAYSRTHLLSDFENQKVVHKNSDLILRPGQSFAVVSGLGGKSVREQKRGGDWWASVYTASQGATHGALFCTFNDFTADCYFKAVDGSVPDRFTLRLATGGDNVEQAAAPAPPAPQAQAPQESGQPEEAYSNGAPKQPGNLHADIYSDTFFEVFWDRVPNAYMEYEISLDGNYQDTSDGTSWYFRRAEAGRSYVLDVVAIDILGNRSPASTVIIEGSKSKPAPPTSQGGSSKVKQPKNAWIQVYSRSTAELFWERPATETRIVTTQIYRDDVLIGETNGISYMDKGRVNYQKYTYKLVAKNASGQSSKATKVKE